MGTVGTTSTCAIDPISDMAPVCQKHGIWLHVDAAYVGTFAVCPEYRSIWKGSEKCDSVSTNPHKSFFCNFDLCAMFVANREPLLDALSVTPSFLRTKEFTQGLVSDYRNWQTGLGREFRALKLWFVMELYGLENLRNAVRKRFTLAEYFQVLVEKDERFSLYGKPRLSLVCFTVVGLNAAQHHRLLQAINDSGVLFLVHTEIEGRVIFRFPLAPSLTEKHHILEAWSCIQEQAQFFLDKA